MEGILTDGRPVKYIYSWRTYKEIVARLSHVDGIHRSVRWLKKQYKRLGLKRRGRCHPPDNTLKVVIEHICHSSDGLRGYRAVWKILRDRYRIIVPRDKVMVVMREVDKEGVAQRRHRRLKRRVYRSKGPNYLWHADGYDKLAPFGIRIHGCIDGYSRKILWMELSPTNHDPRVIVGYYLNTVANQGGCPSVLRCDYGTENVHVATAQMAFRMEHDDRLAGEKAFMYGPSTSNIRIEAWWSQLRRYKTHWWIDLFKRLLEERWFDPHNQLHKSALAFVMVPILTKEVSDFVRHWNSHRIRPSTYAVGPGGIPNDLYDMPGYYGAEDCLKPVDTDVWLQVSVEKSQPTPPFYCEEFSDWADTVYQHMGLSHRNVTSANCREVYIKLVQYLNVCDLI